MSSSAASGGHTPEGSFSSRLRHLLRGTAQGESPDITQARNSFVDAIGLNSPEARDGVPPEVCEEQAFIIRVQVSVCSSHRQSLVHLGVHLVLYASHTNDITRDNQNNSLFHVRVHCTPGHSCQPVRPLLEYSRERGGEEGLSISGGQ